MKAHRNQHPTTFGASASSSRVRPGFEGVASGLGIGRGGVASASWRPGYSLRTSVVSSALRGLSLRFGGCGFLAKPACRMPLASIVTLDPSANQEEDL